MRILQICPFFYPVKGGMEEHVFQISKELIKNGHDVIVFTSDSGRTGRVKNKFEIIANIPVHRFKTLLSFGDFGKFWPAFISKLLKEKYDIVHVHGYRHFHTLLSVMICKIRKIPCILTTHSPFHPLITRKIFSRFLVLFYDLFLGKILNPLFSRVILITDSEMQHFQYLNKRKLVIIPNGISKEILKKINKNTKYKISKKFHIKKDDKPILFTGRIHPTKGLYFLLKSFCELFKKHKNLKLIVVGPVQDQRYFNKLTEFVVLHNLKNFVTFTGFLPEDEKLALYDISTLFILPSIYEPFGIVILEAFARGKPVVAVDSDGPRFLIKNKENGFLVKYGDTKSMVKYIEVLLRDKKLYQEISKNNKEKVKKFMWDKITKKLIKVYEEVLREKNS